MISKIESFNEMYFLVVCALLNVNRFSFSTKNQRIGFDQLFC